MWFTGILVLLIILNKTAYCQCKGIGIDLLKLTRFRSVNSIVQNGANIRNLFGCNAGIVAWDEHQDCVLTAANRRVNYHNLCELKNNPYSVMLRYCKSLIWGVQINYLV